MGRQWWLGCMYARLIIHKQTVSERADPSTSGGHFYQQCSPARSRISGSYPRMYEGDVPDDILAGELDADACLLSLHELV